MTTDDSPSIRPLMSRYKVGSFATILYAAILQSADPANPRRIALYIRPIDGQFAIDRKSVV